MSRKERLIYQCQSCDIRCTLKARTEDWPLQCPYGGPASWYLHRSRGK